MKYIRTKDGRIYDSFALRVQEIAYKDKHGKWCREWQTINPLEKALKVADTIEELCDEFVCCYDNNMYGVFGNLEYAKTQNPKVLYGAIFTDKGLIYVAKMNDKGEMELL